MPQAAKRPEWMAWQVEGTENGPAELTSPDGRQFILKPNESFLLVPDRPTDGNEPEPFIRLEDGSLVAFEQWAADHQ